MWRSVAIGVVLAVVMAGCGVGGGSGAVSHPQGGGGYLGATYGATASSEPSTATTEDIPAERFAIKRDVAKWKAHHPGGTCTIEPPSSAQCTTADGLSTDLQVIAEASTP